ncbi:glycosyltransferase family 4 protein [Lichenihabitans psoromatis]|uniref:glycosyltransferase family 4 protein n=1 Tax=Lichenihabitans psoromatis TaxID=2528642 RepID=UPI001FDFAD67|nr:glycosyltransferase family 4 protein [Lichenihabitans psoromatis]
MMQDDAALVAPVPLCSTPLLVAISDFREGWPPVEAPDVKTARELWASGAWGPKPVVSDGYEMSRLPVTGGYLERLPLACIRRGLVDRAEIWHHLRATEPGPLTHDNPVLARRSFPVSGDAAPFRSDAMVGFVQAFGAPKILCVWGLGVDATLLSACERSFRIYNSIDAPSLRIPPEVSQHIDLVLTGAEWQSDEVRDRHPDMPCAVLPIGPDFADPDTFRPLKIEKRYDVVYVAAAQPYKRHDILFDALARSPRPLKALCVFGYGEMSDDLRRQAADLRLDIDFVGPPGVGFEEVNRLMNMARVGVVCGVDDGAPAIITEYMLAGLPVLANAGLRCGLEYILPETGRIAGPDAFGTALLNLVDSCERIRPRDVVERRWTWPHSVDRLASLIIETPKGRALWPALAASP